MSFWLSVGWIGVIFYHWALAIILHLFRHCAPQYHFEILFAFIEDHAQAASSNLQGACCLDSLEYSHWAIWFSLWLRLALCDCVQLLNVHGARLYHLRPHCRLSFPCLCWSFLHLWTSPATWFSGRWTKLALHLNHHYQSRSHLFDSLIDSCRLSYHYARIFEYGNFISRQLFDLWLQI